MKEPTNFKNILLANAQAFDAMGSLRTRASDTNATAQDLTAIVHDAFSNVAVMAEEYIHVLPKERTSLRNAFSRSYENAIYVIQQISVVNGGDCASTPPYGLLQGLFSQNGNDDLFRYVEELPKEFEHDINVSYVTTLHGMIRFLHQRLIELAFDAKQLENEYDLARLQVGNGTFHLLDLDNQIVTKNGKELSKKDILCRPLHAIFDFYEKDIPTAGSEEYYAFLKKNAINAHVSINCHSAEIDAKLQGNCSLLSIRYNEYLNENWRERLQYLRSAMTFLGMTSTIKNTKGVQTNRTVRNDSIVARKECDETSVYSTITELVRLLASSTHLNCVKFDQLTVDDALKVFFEGKTTNLYENVFNGMCNIDAEQVARVKDLASIETLVEKRLKKLGIQR